MKSDKQVMQDHDDTEYLKRPHLWQHGEFATLKTRMVAGEIKVAIVEYRDGVYRVLENMTMFGTSFGEPVIVHHYETAEQVVAAGWMVD